QRPELPVRGRHRAHELRTPGNLWRKAHRLSVEVSAAYRRAVCDERGRVPGVRFPLPEDHVSRTGAQLDQGAPSVARALVAAGGREELQPPDTGGRRAAARLPRM